MKVIVRISLLSLFICLLAAPALAQKRDGKPAPMRSAASSPRTICQGDAIPKGFVVVEATRSSKCVELAVKKPAASEIVCDGSPVPADYSVVRVEASSRCSGASANPLTNALFISSEDVPTQPVKRAASRRRNNDDDEDEYERPRTSIRITIGGNSQSEPEKSPLEKRADEALRQTRVSNAVKNKEVQPGLNKDQVILIWGNPSKVESYRSGADKYDTWYYYASGARGTVNFKNGIVVNSSYEIQ